MTQSIRGSDLPGGGYYRFFEEFSDKHDTPENRALLAFNLAALATDSLTKVSNEALADLRKRLGDWLDAQSGDVVIGWLADEQIVPSYDLWLEDRE